MTAADIPSSEFKVSAPSDDEVSDISTASLAHTLSGPNGLESVTYPITDELREITGRYPGMRKFQSVNRRTGTFGFSIDLNPTTKFLLSGRGKFIVFEDVMKSGDTVVATIRSQAKLSNTDRTERPDGTFGIDVSGNVVTDLAIT